MIYTFNVDWFPRKTGQKKETGECYFWTTMNLQQSITLRSLSENKIFMFNVIPVFLQQWGFANTISWLIRYMDMLMTCAKL